MVLSQVHRVRALELFAEFIDLGVWAVNVSLCVGVYPYMLKLLSRFVCQDVDMIANQAQMRRCITE